MDETEFKQAYNEYNDRPCVFAKALLARCAGCSRARRLNIAEREAMACNSAVAWRQCGELLPLLRSNALFALKLTHIEGPLPHGKEIRVQCGGLLGLRTALQPEEESPISDVCGLVTAAAAEFKGLAALPYSAIVKAIVAYEARKRERKSDSA